MKDEGIDSLPSGWIEEELAEVADVKMGQSPPSEAYNRDGRGLPFFQGKADFSDLYASPRVWCAAAGKTAEADDILLSVRAPVGPTNLAPAKCVIGRGLAAIRPIYPFHYKYFIYALRRFANDLARLGTGTTFQAVSGKQVRAMEIPIAPMAEQRRIVAKIEELFSDLDAGVAALERVKANLKRYRAAVLKAAVEGKLTAEWRKKNPATETGEQLLKRILAERQKKWEEDQLKKFTEKRKVPPSGWKEKYQEPESPDVAGLAELPEGWMIAQLKVVAEINPTNDSLDLAPDAPVHFIPMRDVAEEFGGVDTSRMRPLVEVRRGYTQFRSGDVIFAKITPCMENGKLAIVPSLKSPVGYGSTEFHVIRPPTVSLGRWIARILSQESVRKDARGSFKGTAGQLRVPTSWLEVLRIPIPPADELASLLLEVERRLSVADAVAVQVEHSLKRAARLRQSILKRAFEGKLVAQNPADEPASVLLERIKAQRAVVPERPATGQKRVGTPALQGRGGHVTQPVARPTQPTRKERKLSRKIWLARATIAAYGVQALADQPTFGRVQLQKFLYLAQAHIGLDLQFEFEKQAAGPFDRDIYTVESNAVKQGWFYFTGARGDATHYQPGVEIKDRLEWAGRMFKKQLPAIDKLIGHFREMNTDQAELFATIHAVWSELVKDGKPCGEEEIVKGVYAWHESKKRFTPGVIRARVKWMRENGYGVDGPNENVKGRR